MSVLCKCQPNVVGLISNYDGLASVLVPSVLSHRCVGSRKGIRSVKNLNGGMLAWLLVCLWVKVRWQICIRPSWRHCHSLSLAAVNPDWVYLSGAGLPG